MNEQRLPEPPEASAKWAEHTIRPDISLDQALHSFFVFNHHLYGVGTCPRQVFLGFIQRCGLRASNNKHWKLHDLKMLLCLLEQEDCSEIARWYALETLLAHHVHVPLQRDTCV